MEELKLTLSEEKTLITNARSGKANFLGIGIKKFASNKGDIFVKKTAKDKRPRRIPAGNIRMTMPITKVIAKLENKGFLEGGSSK